MCYNNIYLINTFSLNTVHSVLSGTAVKNAIDAARHGDDCNLRYSNCNFNPSAAHKVIVILNKVMKYLNIT